MSEKPIIELTHLCKTFYVGFRRRRVDAVRDLSLCVERGEIFGLIGPNGAGKTTTIKMLTGLIRPTSGEMQLMGYNGFDRRCSRKLGYLPEISYYYESLTAYEILDFYAKLYGIRENRDKIVSKWIDRVGLGHARNKRLGTFSKGMLQRIGLAQALVGDPELVILDEPQSGLDPLGRRDVAELIAECQKAGKTIFFSSHILPDVERLCDRVGVIRNGKMEVVGHLRDLLSKERHIELCARGAVDDAYLAQLRDMPGLTAEAKGDALTLHIPPRHSGAVDDVLRNLLDRGMRIEHVVERGMDLEELFTRDALKQSDDGVPPADEGEAHNSAAAEKSEEKFENNDSQSDKIDETNKDNAQSLTQRDGGAD